MNLPIPVGLILFRPHATFKTQFGIKCLAGSEMGMTAFGHSNMMVGHDAARKVGYMHYTTYLSAIVLSPKDVYVVEDLFCKRYLGGLGVEFWTPDAYQNASSRRMRSIMAVMVPAQTKRLEPKLDVRGRWYTEQKMGLVSEERFSRPLYPGAARANAIWGWYDQGRRDRHTGRDRVPANYVVWQGHEWYYNPKSGLFDDFTPEQGNFGYKVYAGCGKVRNGALKYLTDPGYERRHHK
jgi:hypothetical protein